MRSGTADYYYHYDGLGDVANLTSSSGAKQWTYAYEPYGALRTENKDSRSAPANLMRFTGEYTDSATNLSTGLYYLRARTYDPVTGRFAQLDPLGQAIGDPYVSGYLYVGNQPTRYVDPSGKCFVVCAVIGAAVGGLTYGIRVAVDPNLGWSWKGFGVSVGTGAFIGFTAGAGSALGLGFWGSTALGALASASASTIGSAICGASLPGAAAQARNAAGDAVVNGAQKWAERSLNPGAVRQSRVRPWRRFIDSETQRPDDALDQVPDGLLPLKQTFRHPLDPPR